MARRQLIMCDNTDAVTQKNSLQFVVNKIKAERKKNINLHMRTDVMDAVGELKLFGSTKVAVRSTSHEQTVMLIIIWQGEAMPSDSLKRFRREHNEV